MVALKPCCEMMPSSIKVRKQERRGGIETLLPPRFPVGSRHGSRNAVVALKHAQRDVSILYHDAKQERRGGIETSFHA